jgi:hypothetical protein
MKSEHQTAADVAGANKAIAIGLLEAIVAGDTARIESLIDPAASDANWEIRPPGTSAIELALLRQTQGFSSRQVSVFLGRYVCDGCVSTLHACNSHQRGDQ